MKKTLKIVAIVIASVFALLIILPFAFQGKIEKEIKSAINENVNARIDFDGFRLSFIRSFPDVSFRLNGLSVVNEAPFEGDTLMHVKSFFVSVNLMSVFGSDGFEIKTITIDQPYINIQVLKDGTANWDIVPETEEKQEIEETDSEPMDFKLALKRFRIKDAHIIYDDKDMDVYARLKNFNHTLRGDFTASTTHLSIRRTFIEQLFVRFEGIPLLNGVHVDFSADIFADLEAFSFDFLDNRLRMNDLILHFDGNISMPGDDISMDITFGSPQTEFKSFLSLVPAIYAQDFDGLETSGTLEFNGFAKGIVDEENIPAFALNVKVEEGMFRYPDLPASVRGVNINTHIHNPGGSPDKTVVDVQQFVMQIADNPVDFKMHLRTPVSDPQIDAYLQGKLDLATIKDVYPMEEGESMTGIVESNIKAKGRLSSIENERYNEFVFDGMFTITDMLYASADMPTDVNLSKMDFRFSPQHVELRSFLLEMGESDFSASGRIDNLLGFALNDEVLSGSFQTRSKYFNLNPFMEGEPQEQAPEADEPMELSVIEIPENLNFTLRSSFDKLIFDNLEMTQVNGTIRVANQSVRLQNLRMNMLEGSMVLNGSYTAKNTREAEVDFDLDIRQFDIQKTFHTFNTFQTIAPIGERAHGKFSAAFNLYSKLDDKMDPELHSLAGGGSFESNNIKISNSPVLVGLADRLKMDTFKELNARDVQLNFAFKDGRVEVEPFDMKFGSSTANVSGGHSFDQSINYLISFAIPRSEFGGAANEALSGLVSSAAAGGLSITPGQTVHVGANITGTVSDPRFALSLAQSPSDIKDQAKEQIRQQVDRAVEEVKEQAQEVVDDAKERAQQELERRAQQVVTEAERQAANIRREAASAAKKLRDEARTNAKRLEDQATNPVAKAAAKRTGQEMINAADSNAKKLENEADEKAKKLEREAKQKADKIRAGKE